MKFDEVGYSSTSPYILFSYSLPSLPPPTSPLPPLFPTVKLLAGTNDTECLCTIWSALTDHICGETAAVGVNELQHSKKDGRFDV